ncbi:VG15 protein [Streptomyces cacaoi]|uniref:VG15 protein n=1 Tax=Streptomyces cacaoi TaxID=1898 RepID=UPI003748C850
MATTRVSDGGERPDRYRRAQRGLTRLLLRDVRGLRRLILPQRLRQTMPDWLAAVQAVVDQYAAASASLAADWYEAERAAARVPGRFPVPLADTVPPEKAERSLRWATKDVWPQPEDEATEAQAQPVDVRLAQAEKKTAGVAQKLVADTGRETVVEAVRRDREATGWARTAGLKACTFCKMLAIRGAVYSDDTARFQAHDNCHCMTVPVFRGQRFELSDKAKEWERLYREYAAPYSGDQLARFRRALAEHGHLPAAH